MLLFYIPCRILLHLFLQLLPLFLMSRINKMCIVTHYCSCYSATMIILLTLICILPFLISASSLLLLMKLILVLPLVFLLMRALSLDLPLIVIFFVNLADNHYFFLLAMLLTLLTIDVSFYLHSCEPIL